MSRILSSEPLRSSRGENHRHPLVPSPVKLIDRPLPLCMHAESPDAMVPCDAVLGRVWEYLDGEVPPHIARVIDTHLACCPGCHAQYTFQQAFLRYLRRFGRLSLRREGSWA